MSRTKRQPKLASANPGLTPRARHLLKKYGITLEQYEHLYRAQEGRCAVCKRTAETFRHRLSVDHDHKTGEVRGLLCVHCNRYIVGRHRRDLGSDLLKAGYEYLTREYPGWIVPPKVRKKKHARRKRLWQHLVHSPIDLCFSCHWCLCLLHEVSWYLSYTAVLDVYTIEQILELNDLTTEECLEFLVDEGYIILPRIKPLDFND